MLVLRSRWLARSVNLFIVLAACLATSGCVVGSLFTRAPLGRSTNAIRLRLGTDLPKGTSLDSAKAYLTKLGISWTLLEGKELRQFEYDSLFAKGPVLRGYQPKICSGLLEGWVQFHLYFSERLLLTDGRVWCFTVGL
jgi:hypothetical protein